MHLLGKIALVLTCLLAMPALAQWKDWDYSLDEEKKSWQELQAKLPAYPKPENLLKFDIGANSNNTFFVDAGSLSAGDDGVVRYTLVVKTSGGATNVSFEGIRCESRQARVYAFGHADRQWSRARNAGWHDIQHRQINGYHHVLLKDYFCSNRKHMLPLRDIVTALKNGPKHLSD